MIYSTIRAIINIKEGEFFIVGYVDFKNQLSL